MHARSRRYPDDRWDGITHEQRCGTPLMVPPPPILQRAGSVGGRMATPATDIGYDDSIIAAPSTMSQFCVQHRNLGL